MLKKLDLNKRLEDWLSNTHHGVRPVDQLEDLHKIMLVVRRRCVHRSEWLEGRNVSLHSMGDVSDV